MDIDGDEFAENDYGLAVDDSEGTLKFQQQLNSLAQAALQGQLLDFSTIMKMYSSCSLAEKQQMIEDNENELKQMKQQEQQATIQSQQQIAQQQMQQKQLEMDQKEAQNVRDNQTKLAVAQIQASLAEGDGIKPDKSADEIMEQIREFNAKLGLEERKLSVEIEKAKMDHVLKKKQIESSNKTKK